MRIHLSLGRLNLIILIRLICRHSPGAKKNAARRTISLKVTQSWSKGMMKFIPKSHANFNQKYLNRLIQHRHWWQIQWGNAKFETFKLQRRFSDVSNWSFDGKFLFKHQIRGLQRRLHNSVAGHVLSEELFLSSSCQFGYQSYGVGRAYRVLAHEKRQQHWTKIKSSD